VSPATVSRVINNNPNVSAATREKVLRIMQRADYTPNAFASGIGRNAMRLVGILCTDTANLYYGKVVSLLVQNLRNVGFDALLCCTGTAFDDKKAALAELLQKRVDAIILVGSAYREERNNAHIREAAKQVPVFLVNAYVQIPNVYCVLCDEREAMANSVRRLAETGRREILYLHDMKKWAWAGSQKLQGYLDGLEACGIARDDTLIHAVENTIPAAHAFVQDALREGARFSAIIASEDILAVGAQKAVRQEKRGIAVLGFNNSQYALCATPELSSVDNMMDTICPMVVSMLDRLFAGEKITAKVVVSACLIERESFG
ncbi:LacI family transcriptional regulator, partial [Eubacteriales bacterium OttesenSCG-928-A19]|nr:LacI family transcriptional regulator [Eubacteriales bacterium OttesenSCG-928-A19]